MKAGHYWNNTNLRVTAAEIKFLRETTRDRLFDNRRTKIF
jgi:hypothetical protein